MYTRGYSFVTIVYYNTKQESVERARKLVSR
jgi:hypothetical protein